jgi:hypothetical protein
MQNRSLKGVVMDPLGSVWLRPSYRRSLLSHWGRTTSNKCVSIDLGYSIQICQFIFEIMPEILKTQFIVCLFDALNYDVKHGNDFYSGGKMELVSKS